MLDICAYGCGNPGIRFLKNGSPCCSKSPNGCPGKKARVSAARRGTTPSINWEEKIKVICPKCGVEFKRRRSLVREKEIQKKDITCSACSNSIASTQKWKNYDKKTRDHILKSLHDGGKNYSDNLSAEERIERSRAAGSANTSYSAIQQWKSIKKNPEMMDSLRKQRSRTTKEVWASYTPEERNLRIKAMLGDRKISKTCTEFLNQVEMIGICVQREVPISGFVVDGLHEETKTILAFHGDFWHCNPKTYIDKNQYCSWLGRTVGEQQLRDKRRLGVFYNLGYSVVVVWESAWKESPSKEVSRVQEAIKKKTLSAIEDR